MTVRFPPTAVRVGISRFRRPEPAYATLAETEAVGVGALL
jgi:hypothetical protein